MSGILTKKLSEIDFDIIDFNNNDFECSGNGFIGNLVKLTIGMYYDINYYDEKYFEVEGNNLIGVLIKNE